MKRGRTTRLAILTGNFEPATTGLMKRDVKQGMHVFDVGANIGWFTLVMSKLVGVYGHVYAFEPDPYLFNILKDNVELNNLSNVSVYPLAVSNKSGKAKLSINSLQDGDNRLESRTMTEDIIDIETITIDEFCERNNVIPDYVKMDVQGSEPKIYEGMAKSISSNPNVKIITEFYPLAIIDVGASAEDFVHSIERSGFIIKEIDEGSSGYLKPVNREKLFKMKNKWLNLYCYKP